MAPTPASRSTLTVDSGRRAAGRTWSLARSKGKKRRSVGDWKPSADAIAGALFPDLMLFAGGAMPCTASGNRAPPDGFLAFDVFARARDGSSSSERRDALARALGLAVVPRLAAGRSSRPELEGRLTFSRFSELPLGGLYVRREQATHLVARAKLVRPEFVQGIVAHRSPRVIESNLLAAPSPAASAPHPR